MSCPDLDTPGSFKRLDWEKEEEWTGRHVSVSGRRDFGQDGETDRGDLHRSLRVRQLFGRKRGPVGNRRRQGEDETHDRVGPVPPKSGRVDFARL